MKKGVALKGLVIIIFVWVIIPLVAIHINKKLGLLIFYNPIVSFIGWIVFALSMAVLFSLIDMHFKTGRITPIGIEAPKKLITTGLYKHSRNPIYLAIIAMFLGRFLIKGDFLLLVSFVVSIPLLHLTVVYKEEPELYDKFGKSYKKYCADVPRWL